MSHDGARFVGVRILRQMQCLMRSDCFIFSFLFQETILIF